MPEKEKRKVAEGDTLNLLSFPVRLRPENPGLAHNNKPQADVDKGKVEDGADLQGVYVISVAARILEMHPQTLRKYERLGLVTPSRTLGMLRLYSQEDIEKLRLIRHLESNLGLNLAGVEFTLELLNHLLEMHQKLSMLKEAQEFVQVVEQEMTELFRRLNLPVQEDAS